MARIVLVISQRAGQRVYLSEQEHNAASLKALGDMASACPRKQGGNQCKRHLGHVGDHYFTEEDALMRLDRRA